MGGHQHVINLIFVTWEHGILNLPVLFELEGEFDLWGNDFSNKTCNGWPGGRHAHTTAVMR